MSAITARALNPISLNMPRYGGYRSLKRKRGNTRYGMRKRLRVSMRSKRPRPRSGQGVTGKYES